MKEKKRNLLMIGKKLGMTQIYNESGALIPVTIVKMCHASVLGFRTQEKDTYSAVILGFNKEKSEDDRKSSSDFVREVRLEDIGQYQLNEELSANEFSQGEKVDVIGTTKGHGFQGVMKRHGFSGGPAAHGSMFHRRGGSFGQRQWPGHVYKGRKMPGHDGCERRTVQNLQVVEVHNDQDLLVIRGSFPGANGDYVVVRRAKKS